MNIITSIVRITILSAIIISSSFIFSNAQTIDNRFFNEVDDLLKARVSNGLVDYDAIKTDKRLPALIQKISEADISSADSKTLQAFYINAYNLNVINKVVSIYPVSSLQEKSGFFSKDKIKVAGESTTLNKLEKEKLLESFGDARYHFVLVCGALGCPPITNFAYTPENLEAQLAQQTRLAFDDSNFIRTSDGNVELSQIFQWYPKDFGTTKENIINFINEYRTEKIPNSAKIKYYNYDWSLNDTADTGGSSNNTSTNSSRYIVSSTIAKGAFEFKIFNNLYSQKTGDRDALRDRSSFFTTSLSAFYGLSNRLNVGLNTRFRKVRNNALPSTPFSVFGSDEAGSSRSGLTAIGPQIRYAPVPKWENFSIQSSFVFPVGTDLTGSATQPFIDWNGPTSTTQFFNDFSIGSKFSIFTEVDLIIEDIGSASEGRLNRISTPATLIFSYVPTNELTIYTISGYSPFWQSDFDYFTQLGLGAKYQFTPNFEVELLYTDFSNKFLNETGGQAQTINLGIRYNL